MKVFFITLLLLALAGCADETVSPQGKPLADTSYSFSVFDDFGQERSHFSQNEIINLRISVSNNSQELQKLLFSNAQWYDFEVLDLDGESVWLWSNERVFASAISRLEIPSQASKIYSEQWDLSILNEALQQEPLPVGEYEFRGYFVGYDAPASVQVFIQP